MQLKKKNRKFANPPNRTSRSSKALTKALHFMEKPELIKIKTYNYNFR